jgi:hypothetical protein
VGDRSRGRFATPADFPLQYGTPYRGYAHGVGVWDLSIIQGPFTVGGCCKIAAVRALLVVLYPGTCWTWALGIQKELVSFSSRTRRTQHAR